MIVEEDPDRTGPAATRNRAAARANGEFLAFLDDDDAWQPEYLARVVPPAGYALGYCALAHLPSHDPREGSPTVPSYEPLEPAWG